MVQSVAALRLSEAVVDVVEKVKGIHIVESGRHVLVKELLMVGVEVLSVVHDDLPRGRTHKPLVERLEERNIEGAHRRID